MRNQPFEKDYQEDNLSTTYLKKILGLLGFQIISIIDSNNEITIKIKHSN